MPTPPASTETPINPKDLIEGLAKGLRLIEAFNDEHPRLSPSQAAALCGITRTAARRHLLTLVHLDYAATDGKLFWLAPRVLRLGESYLEAARLPRLVQPFIQQLSTKVGETVNFSVLDGHEVVYLGRSNSPRLVSIGFHAGDRVPAHVVAPGVALAATLTEDALARWVRAHEFTSFTAHTVGDAAEFVKRVQSARAAGFWIAEQHLTVGLTGVAVALTDRRGRCHGAIGMTVPLSAWPRADIASRLVPALQATADSLRLVL